jgi:hypothetical protein
MNESHGLGLRVFVAPTSALARAVTHSALHERMLFLYVLGLLVGVALGGGAHRDTAAVLLTGDLLLLSAAIVAVRAPLIDNRFALALVARLIVLGGILGTFAQLHIILPAARSGTVDATLHALDLRLFGFEPASAWDRWVSRSTTEWFAFFYFSYFGILAAHVIPVVFLEKRLRIVGEISLGMVAVYGIGQLTYVLVPAFGPYQTLSFAHPLDGARWWSLVQSGVLAVDERSRTDVFPSLHTAGPVFLAIFSFRHRALFPFRYTWPVVLFFALQIIVATMFLRWHYLVDVIAGVVLAAMAAALAAPVSSDEMARRRELGLGPVWTRLRLRDLL